MADDEAENFKRRLEVIPTSGAEDDETCLTFVLHEEDHTLGNALRYMIAKNSDVGFCGYTIPHPSEHKINIRIQTNGILAVDALRKGLSDLSDLCDHVQEKFETAVKEFREEGIAMDEESD
ncbi:DNA-directed RNA polymerases I and III subunit RPAC2-like [Dendronephthya gigantea]|uniref:DNA-directed RNA polymerases I and III subunit RPAC2-like n=1 Tax=Dendronephthya gigantea TaxID=151771 RepID=UPI00106CE33A|nr:DNA-directed RNA polymerases I and III subunit RPAC2-like [Dendronephthya gigantea]